MKTIPLASIKFGTRFRKEMGDVHTLARSIEQFGLFHPIVVDKDNQLVSGLRRIRAFKHLGRKEIPVTVLDLDDLVGAEYDENVERKSFTPSEMVAIKEALEAKEVAAAKERQSQGGSVGKLPEAAKGRALDKIAKAAGTSRRTIEKAEKVVKAAKADPEKHGKLAEEMDKDGKVDKAYKRLKEAEAAEAAKAAQKYSTIVVSPDWEENSERRKLVQIPVWKWADENSHLYLVTPNEYVPKALQLLEDWKFTYATILTWVKPRADFGEHFRNSTTQIVFAVKGKEGTRVKDLPTHFEAPVPGDGSMPEEFYRIVERASSGPYFDALGKSERAGWVVPNGVKKV